MNESNNWFLYLSVFSANLLSFSSNAAFPWTSPFLPKLNGNVDPEDNPLGRPITVFESSWITTLISIGSFCGPLFTGQISAKIGKKMTIVAFTVPVVISNVILIFANQVYHFYISRFLVGLGIGCVFCVIPTYVAEITNVTDRGKMGLILTLMNSICHFCVVCLGPYVTIRTFAYLSLIPSVIFFVIFLPFVPETPYYYISINQMEKAENVLKRFRQKADVKVELAEIAKSVEETRTKGSLKDIISSKVVLKGMLITTGLMLCQQVTGIQPLNAYLQDIFTSTGTSIPSELAVIAVAVASFLVVFLVIGLVDKLGRKLLLIISCSGVMVSLIFLSVYAFLLENDFNLDSYSWIPIVSGCMYTVTFRFGIGPIPWSIVGEIFPSNLKVYLSSIVTFLSFLFGFIVTFIFPFMFAYLGLSWTFMIFAICGAATIWFCCVAVPEINGKSFTEIQNILKN